MSIVRVRKDTRYFTASNEPFVDESLSWESRGLMGYLLTKPNNWEVRIADLEKKGPAGNHKMRRMLAELRRAGYMNRIRLTLEKGKFDWVTEVFESPSLNPRKSASGGFSTSGPSTSGKLPDIVITDPVITEERDSGDPVFTALAEMLGGGLPMESTRYVDTWREFHKDEWILKAIAKGKEKGARAIQYVDTILVGWKANGYPKSFEQRVKEAKKPGTVPAETPLEQYKKKMEAQANGN